MPVTPVTDLIELLAARRHNRAMLDRRTGLPYSWTVWMQGWMPVASAFAAGNAAEVAAQRPRPQGIPRSSPSFAQALLWLLRWQGDDPPPRDQRSLRWLAVVCSAGLHLLFALLLMWVALVRSNPPEADAEAGERVQVEYIGRGTPQEEGGGAPQAQGQEQAAAQAASASEAGASHAQQAQVSAQEPQASGGMAGEAAPVPVDVSSPVPEPQFEQPLQVTEASSPTTDFVLPAATVAAPELRSREPQVRERSIEMAVERPVLLPSLPLPEMTQSQPRALQEVQVRERQVEMAVHEPVTMARVPTREAEVRMATPVVRERQIEVAPRQEVAMSTVATREIGVQVKAPETPVRERQIPGMAEVPATAAPAAGTQTRQVAGEGAAVTANQSAAPGRESAARSAVPSGSSPGAGPKPQDRSGGWAAPARADDWGASSRQVDGSAGGQADAGRGLFNADGSVRLAGEDGQGESMRGAPGGDSDSWTRERIAQSGTWLKRPPYDYTPTSFDKYWVPNESLLAEWVRKGVKSIEIPIPGTGTRISCVVSMLQFGGGCGLSNPNMQEQPAQARPPPDIPFKKELQEDNGSR